MVDLGDADLKLTGEDEDDLVGVALSGAGDVNGDGYDEVVIGAYNEDTAGREGGAAYLLLGGSY